ncbi:uncharacterized protein LOC125493623 [Beta vulgaris subsp. vulgaris]|uniref:uncharacterized protein LOC125493623 n=1 Tax=Beta vulgaris subsp. vulgaris TaxID=3555 RepID=UPI002036F437|nr:uncharacterized protein LOC125493623 [Beta vulgaris subsp. vulgaris]
MNVEPVFPIKRRVIRKRYFGENNEDQESQSSEESFRVNYFLIVVDMAKTSLKNRFEELKTFESIFGFLYNSQKLKSLDENELKECCQKFYSTFSHGNLSDVIQDGLFSELKVLQFTLPNESMSAIEILKYVKSADCYSNVAIAYRVLLTVLVTVASAERSFSKLKLIKTYLRSSMAQERLNGLATLSIEKDMLENIDLDVTINDFVSQNARRSRFV